MFFQVVFFTHILLCVALVGLVLLQQGKGAELGASLSGGSDSLFGAGGAADMMTKVTTGLAVAFMITSVLLVKHYNRVSLGKQGTNNDVLAGSMFEGDAEAKAKKVSPVVDSSAKDEVASEDKSSEKEKGSAKKIADDVAITSESAVKKSVSDVATEAGVKVESIKSDAQEVIGDAKSKVDAGKEAVAAKAVPLKSEIEEKAKDVTK